MNAENIKKGFALIASEMRELLTAHPEWIEDEKNFEILINAYNAFQEYERYGVDYIFDTRKKDDLKGLIDGGITLAELSELHSNLHNFCLFGENYTTPKCLSPREVFDIIVSNATEITAYALLYPKQKEYADWVQLLLTNPVVCNSELYLDVIYNN